jgi:hypothetical protein
MHRRLSKNLLLLFVALAMTGCASTPKAPSENGGMFRRRNEGYSLLYKLMSDESQVSGIFILKHADDSVGNVVRDVAHFCQYAKTQMDGFPNTDNRIEYDVPDLPRMEQDSRDLTAKEVEHELLGSSGKEFELNLIFTQAQAMEYAVQLATALQPIEDDPVRHNFLVYVAQQCDELHSRLMALLEVKP